VKVSFTISLNLIKRPEKYHLVYRSTFSRSLSQI